MTTTPTPSMLSFFTRILVLWSLLSLLFHCCVHAQDLGQRKVHIVFLDHSAKSSEALALKLLGQVLERGKPADSLIYTFHAINGFAARLTASEAEKLRRFRIVVSVEDDRSYHLDARETLAPERS